jgi:hypothetical protein
VSGLFGRDEMEEITQLLVLPLKKFDKTIEPNPENLQDFYKVDVEIRRMKGFG